MIFINSPFTILDEAFRGLYPDKKYKACIEPDIKDNEGNQAFGFTQFNKGEIPVIAISAELSITDATEIFAHELAHVAAGEGAGHGERWDEEFQKIFNEYNRIGRERFGEDRKMLKLPDSDRQMIQPEASREDIRELKRFNKTEPAAGVADDTSQLIEKFFEDNKDTPI